MWPAPEGPGGEAEYLVVLAERAYNVNPKMPNPIAVNGEAELDQDTASEWNGGPSGDAPVSVGRLVFEDDAGLESGPGARQ